MICKRCNKDKSLKEFGKLYYINSKKLHYCELCKQIVNAENSHAYFVEILRRRSMINGPRKKTIKPKEVTITDINRVVRAGKKAKRKTKRFNMSRKLMIKPKTCSVCHEKKPSSRHHIVPRALGGTDNVSNLVWLCKDCHDKIETQTDDWIKSYGGIELFQCRTSLLSVWN